MPLVLQPFAVISVAVCVLENAKAAHTVLFELAFKYTTVRAGHCAMSMAVAAQPLANIHPTILKFLSPVRAAAALVVASGQIVSGGL